MQRQSESVQKRRHHISQNITEKINKTFPCYIYLRISLPVPCVNWYDLKRCVFVIRSLVNSNVLYIHFMYLEQIAAGGMVTAPDAASCLSHQIAVQSVTIRTALP